MFNGFPLKVGISGMAGAILPTRSGGPGLGLGPRSGPAFWAERAGGSGIQLPLSRTAPLVIFGEIS